MESRPTPEMPARTGRDGAVGCLTIAVASGPGSAGRTVVALNLAAALGAAAPTVLVDADLAGPSVAAYLDADPTRNLSVLAHADPRTPAEWDRALAAETQPLAARSPRASVLCGVPKPEMRAGVSERFFRDLLAELARRHRFVVLDVGADLLGAGATLHRVALGLAGQILFVATADLVGLAHARAGLRALRDVLGVAEGRVALVVTRHDPRVHHPRAEIEWALGRPVAAVIPEDPAAIQRALLAQRPVVFARRSRAGRALLDLAERVHGGRILLTPEAPRTGRAWLPRVGSFRPRWPLVGRPRRPSPGGVDANRAAIP